MSDNGKELIEELTAKIIDQRLAAFDRRIKTQRDYIAESERMIKEILAEKTTLIQAATARWTAQMPGEQGE